jgi:hypothetical protein
MPESENAGGPGPTAETGTAELSPAERSAAARERLGETHEATRSIPRIARKEIAHYLFGFAKQPATPPLSEARLAGKKGKGEKSREQVEAETAYAKYLLKRYDGALKKGERTDPNELILYLRSRAEHKMRQAYGGDPNVTNKKSQQKSTLEWHRLNQWIVALGGEPVTEYAEREERPQRPEKSIEERAAEIGPIYRPYVDYQPPTRTAGAAPTRTPPPTPPPEEPPSGEERPEESSVSVEAPARAEQPSREPPEPPPSAEAREPITSEAIRELATQIIAFNVENYEQLNAATEAEGQQRFNEVARKFFEQLVVHGSPGGEYYYGVDAATDNPIIFNTTDLDGRGAIALMRMAGVDTSKIEYVKSSDKIEGKTNLDTGDRWGLAVVLPEGGAQGLDPEEIKKRNLRATIFIDHHGPEAQKGYSATKGVYETLVRLGMLEKTPVIDKTVEFITRMDNGIFPFETYERSDRTVAGLAHRMRLFSSPDGKIAGLTDVMAAFPEEADSIGEHELSDGDIEILDLQRASKEKRREIEESRRALRDANENGFIVESPEYGRIVVDVGSRVDGGWQAIKCPTILGEPADVYIKWMPRTNSFFISASRDFDPRVREIIEAQGGIVVRGNMGVKIPAERGEEEPAPQTIAVAGILSGMGIGREQIDRSRARPDGSFNTQGLYAAIQREQENTGVNIYRIPPRPQRR